MKKIIYLTSILIIISSCEKPIPAEKEYFNFSKKIEKQKEKKDPIEKWKPGTDLNGVTIYGKVSFKETKENTFLLWIDENGGIWLSLEKSLTTEEIERLSNVFQNMEEKDFYSHIKTTWMFETQLLVGVLSKKDNHFKRLISIMKKIKKVGLVKKEKIAELKLVKK